MSVTKAFRFKHKEDRDYVIGIVNKVTDQYHDQIEIQGDAIVKLCTLFESGYDVLGNNELPKTVHDTFRLCDCEFIKYDTNSAKFFCYENYHKNKKKLEIGKEPDAVISNCVLCKIGTATSIQKGIESQFRKKGVTSMVKLVHDLIRIDQDGGVAQIFLCQGKRWSSDEIVISSDCTHFKCPELDGEYIVIEERCLKQIDPLTMKPPCRYLVSPFLNVPIRIPVETKAVIEEMKRLEELTKIEPDIKTVDAEVIEDEIETVDAEVIEPESTKTNARDIIASEDEEEK